MSRNSISSFHVIVLLLVAVPVGAQLVEIPAFESVRVNGLNIEFEELLFEARCPADVFCIWEGDAAIRVLVRAHGGAPKDFELHTHVSSGNVAEGDGYTLTLVELRPHPLVDEEPVPEEYVATLLVSGTAPRESMSWATVKSRY